MVTRVALVVTLVVTGAIALTLAGDSSAEDLAPRLWILTGLFVFRVVGQVVVALRAPRWLPPMDRWNLMPYPILLPTQIVIVAVMIWIDVAFSFDSGLPTDGGHRFGVFLIGFSAVYAAAMVLRYVVRMRRKPTERWFGGTIPIVFHLVLATYLLALGMFYA